MFYICEGAQGHTFAVDKAGGEDIEEGVRGDQGIRKRGAGQDP